MTILKPNVQQVFYNNCREKLYTGFVKVYVNGRFLFSQDTNIDRLCPIIAFADAVQEKKHMLELNIL